MQAVIFGGGKASSFLVSATCAGIEYLNVVVNGPLDRLVVAGVEVQIVVFHK